MYNKNQIQSLLQEFLKGCMCLGALKQGFRACRREILGLDGCFMSGPWPGRAKCDLLINNIYEVFNRQLVNGRDQPILTCLEYIRKYLMKRIVVVQKVTAKTVGPHTHSVIKMFDGIKKATEYNVQWNGGSLYQVTRPYKDHYVVNMDKRVCSCRKWELTGIPCKHVVAATYNMSENSVGVVVVSKTLIIPPLYKPPIGRPPKKRKNSNDEIASKSSSSGKFFGKGKSVSCDKCGNVGYNRKGCRGQGGGFSQAGARKVSSQAASSKKVSGQAAGARNVCSQAAGARKASSQPSAEQSTTNQGPRQGL
nr:hypothetical protein [Tanacetum cinerariifolium]